MFKVTHIPQVPGVGFEAQFDTLNEADVVRETLADYDLFQLEQNVRPDFSNVSWIEELVDGEWEELDDMEIDERMGRL